MSHLHSLGHDLGTSPLHSAIDAVRMILPLFGQMLDSTEQPYLPFDFLRSIMSLEVDHYTREMATNVAFYGVNDDSSDFVGWHGRLGDAEMYVSVRRAMLTLPRRNPDLSTCESTIYLILYICSR